MCLSHAPSFASPTCAANHIHAQGNPHCVYPYLIAPAQNLNCRATNQVDQLIFNHLLEYTRIHDTSHTHTFKMAKVPNVKKKAVSARSRAGRRQESPEPAPKKAPKGTVDETNDSWMYGATNAGIHKKAPKEKKLTRAQRQRQLKAIEHGERNVDRLEKSVAKSKLRGKRTQNRAQTWEEINAEKQAKIAQAMAAGEGAEVDGAESEEEIEDTLDEDAPDAMKDLDQQPALPEQNLGQSTSIAQEATPILQQATAAVEDIDDDIL